MGNNNGKNSVVVVVTFPFPFPFLFFFSFFLVDVYCLNYCLFTNFLIFTLMEVK